jgi:hypothetical protein
MPEGMNVEFAAELSKAEHEAKEKRRWQELIELIEVVILAIVAVGTAWSGYQAARWDGHQAFEYGTSSRLRFEADQEATAGGQQRLLDVSTFNTWIQARAAGNTTLAALYVRRFSPEFKTAFDAWLATHPFSNPDAPPGPSFMPDYHNALLEDADRLNEEATQAFDEGTAARETADRYVRQTVLLATVLFLIAVEQRFTYRAVRITASVIAAFLMVFAIWGVASLPRL